MAVRGTRLDAGERAAHAAQWSQMPGMVHLGARADFTDPAAIRVSIDRVQPFHRGGMGSSAVNGAVIAGLCDAVIGMAGFVETAGRRVATVQLGLHFLRPLEGDRVVAIGRVTRAGPNLVFAQAEVEDENGQVCARADGVVAVIGDSHAS